LKVAVGLNGELGEEEDVAKNVASVYKKLERLTRKGEREGREGRRAV
jgi:hypothetical protein